MSIHSPAHAVRHREEDARFEDHAKILRPPTWSTGHTVADDAAGGTVGSVTDLRRLRYAGACRGCETILAAGTRAHYDAESRTVTCTDCLPRLAEEVPESDHPSTAVTANAGRSAQQEADRAARAADRLTAKAQRAAHRAAAFTRGAEGEQAVAATVRALPNDDCFILHDRLLPHGGNLDHLVVGPRGVVVLDAKNWSTATEIVDNKLRSAGRDRTSSLTGVYDQVAVVRAALAGTVAALVPVTGIVVLTGEHDRTMPPAEVGGGVVLGLEHLTPHLSGGHGTVPRGIREAAMRVLSEALPPADEVLAPEEIERSHLFYATHRFLYLRPWAKAGRRRLYLTDSAGTELGWKDLATSAVAVTHRPDDALTHALLTGATTSGLTLGRRDVPRLPTTLPLRWKLATAGTVSMAYVVGIRWRKGAADRLYGTYVCRTNGVHPLGYVDLATGRRHPSGPDPVAKDLRTPDQYLKHLHANLPAS